MASALSTPTGPAHDFVSVSEYDALQAKAGLEGTFRMVPPTGTSD
jgi:hypothetical protein